MPSARPTCGIATAGPARLPGSPGAELSAIEILVEIAGWAGAGLILLGYVLVTADKLTGRSPAFQWMNLLGAAGFVINGAWHGAIPSASLNVVWMAIAAFALTRLYRIRRRQAE